jgi:UDP:flavonoid glycosyltransferase YjiC (YdhE family)
MFASSLIDPPNSVNAAWIQSPVYWRRSAVPPREVRSRMNCFVLTLGTHGDVELFRLLGTELSRRGHQVTLGTSPFYRERIEAAGLRFLPVGDGSQEQLAQLFRSLAPLADRRARVRAYAERWVRPQLAHSLAEVKVTLAQTDYFINNLRSVWRTGERLIPGAAVTYDPVGDPENLRKYAAQLADYERAILELVALPKELVDPDDVWGPRFNFTGFWRDPTPSTWTPPAELQSFLDAGPPPVAITMGSMLSFDPVAFASTIREALRLSGQRGILIAGWQAGDFSAESDRDFFVASHVPYEWLFPRCSLVVHHGGAGTVAATLRAGRVSILLPQISSQEHFAKLLHRAGVLVDALDVGTWTPNTLAEAMKTAAADVSFTRAAEYWSSVLANENGLVHGADLIEMHMQQVG